MSNVESYKRSFEIEHFLKRTLKIKEGTSSSGSLHGFYEGLVFYENGGMSWVTPGEHKKRVKRMIKFFERSIDKLSKKHPNLAAQSLTLKEDMSFMQRADDIWELYQRIQQLTVKPS